MSAAAPVRQSAVLHRCSTPSASFASLHQFHRLPLRPCTSEHSCCRLQHWAAAAGADCAALLVHREKFEELTTKERELNAFLDAFPQRRAAKQQELSSKQEAITNLLDKLNRLHALTATALPGKEQYQQLKVRDAAE